MNRDRYQWLNVDEWLSKPRRIIGIMTGTSVDSADIVLAQFSQNNPNKFSYQLIYHRNYKFPKSLRQKILLAINNSANTRQIAQIHYELALFYYQILCEFSKNSLFELSSIDAIGIHGQTVWHEIPQTQHNKVKVPCSLQIGSIGFLSALTNLPVVGDFRSKDIALGGQGAPLVPIFDYHFLRSKNEDIITLNIGGIANITYLPKNCRISQVVGFDTGPGNALIDIATKKLFNKMFDSGGKIASRGKLNTSLINQLMKIEFVHRNPPKSTGRELFSENLVNKILSKAKKGNIDKYDVIASLSYFTAWSIAENIIQYANPLSKIIVSGGGALNNFLVKQLKLLLPRSNIIISEQIGIPLGGKEALAFAFLAYLRLGNIKSNIPSATGAKRRTSLGVVAE
ncbi:MAG: anhydro-N-acetylmuramic acid kinase [Candidatus Kapaibacteriales bacterium]